MRQLTILVLLCVSVAAMAGASAQGSPMPMPAGQDAIKGGNRVEVTQLVDSLSPPKPSEPSVPLKSGTYQFRWKDAEFSRSDGFPVRVELSGTHLRVINERRHGSAPVGELAHGELMWHTKSKQWILGQAESDKLALSVGGCDDADPYVVNFETREIWTCEWGP